MSEISIQSIEKIQVKMEYTFTLYM